MTEAKERRTSGVTRRRIRPACPAALAPKTGKPVKTLLQKETVMPDAPIIAPENSSQIERDKWEFEKDARLREIAIKEREQSSKEGELAIKRDEHAASQWRNPLIVGIFAAAIAAAGNAWVSYSNANSTRELEAQKAEQARLLEMIKTGDPDKAAENLRFLINAGLITDAPLRTSVTNYLETRKPGSGTALPSPAQPPKLTAPIVDNARIYLLAGKKEKTSEFQGLKEELGLAGFSIVGARFKEDAGRRDHPEVRYFNASDKDQSEKIAEFMRFRLNTKQLLASEYKDPTAKPGYIEIWLGR
jgi:hypothetical protein